MAVVGKNRTLWPKHSFLQISQKLQKCYIYLKSWKDQLVQKDNIDLCAIFKSDLKTIVGVCMLMFSQLFAFKSVLQSIFQKLFNELNSNMVGIII